MTNPAGHHEEHAGHASHGTGHGDVVHGIVLIGLAAGMGIMHALRRTPAA
jgi:hypothetical protein